MLKEGWDVRNVTTIVGLRAFAAQNKILPEQTLGRGLRRMFPGTDTTEYVSIVGTDAFMDFVESIQNEGVTLERKPMGEGTGPKTPIVIEVDTENKKKDLDKLDIEIPVLTSRIYREYKNLEELDPAAFGNTKVNYQLFVEEEQRAIVFRDITTHEIKHTTWLDNLTTTDYRNVVGYFAREIMGDLRLVSGYDMLYGKVKEFITHYLFNRTVELEELNTLRNLSEVEATKTIIETFKQKINELTIRDKGCAEIRDYIKLRQTRPFVVKEQGFLVPQRSIFNKIIGDSHLELLFASFLEHCPDVLTYAKNYLAVHFSIDYVKADGNISSYYPDFIVRTADHQYWIVETKGQQDLDVPLKMERLKQWCHDIKTIQHKAHFDYVFVDEEGFNKYKPVSLTELVNIFTGYKQQL
jgi:type III restriction enzyme